MHYTTRFSSLHFNICETSFMDASLLQHVLMDRTHFCKSVSGIQFNVHLGYETLCFTMYLLTCPGSVNAGSSAKTTYLADVFNICKMVLPSDTLFGCQASFSSCPVGASMSPDQKKKNHLQDVRDTSSQTFFKPSSALPTPTDSP